MTNKRLVKEDEANVIDKLKNVTIKEYFPQITPNLGLATSIMKGNYPPEDEGIWTVNEKVDEMFYVLDGSAKIVYQDGEEINLVPKSAAYLPCGLKYRVETQDLHVVVPTGPAWSPEQHKFSDD